MAAFKLYHMIRVINLSIKKLVANNINNNWIIKSY